MSVRHDVRHGADEAGLKLAIRQTVESVGGSSALGRVTPTNLRRWSDFANGNTAVWPSFAQVMELEDIAVAMGGEPHITAYLAGRQRRTLVALPDLGRQVEECGFAHVVQAMARQVRVHGETHEHLLTAIGDGKLTPDEIDDALGKLDEKIEVTIAFRALLQHMRGAAG